MLSFLNWEQRVPRILLPVLSILVKLIIILDQPLKLLLSLIRVSCVVMFVMWLNLINSACRSKGWPWAATNFWLNCFEGLRFAIYTSVHVKIQVLQSESIPLLIFVDRDDFSETRSETLKTYKYIFNGIHPRRGSHVLDRHVFEIILSDHLHLTIYNGRRFIKYIVFVIMSIRTILTLLKST